jgi:hypothetical protein
MTPDRTPKHFREQTLLKPIYLILVFMMGVTGFGQMPIYKRYYIADIPGLTWIAEYYVTHYMHYIGAIMLLVLIVYGIVVYLGLMRKSMKLTWAAYIRIALLAAIVTTGIFRVLKNLPDVVFSPGFTMFIDLAHLTFMVLFMIFGIIFIITRHGWLIPRTL